MRRRRATCTAATSRRSTASPARCCASARSRRGIDPLFDVVDGLAGSLSFDAAYEAFQDELLSARSPELDRALRRGFGLDEIREACELINQYRYLRPLNIPTHEDGELATHLAAVPPDRRRAAGAARAAATPATTPALRSPRGSSSGQSGSRRSTPRPSRSSSCSTVRAPTPI